MALAACERFCAPTSLYKKRKTETNKQPPPAKQRSKESQAGWFLLTGELKHASVVGNGTREGDFPKMTVWSLSVLAVQSLPPQIKDREVAWLSAALSHVKPRRRPYTCSHK